MPQHNMFTINELYRMLNVWSQRVRHTARGIEHFTAAEHALLAYLSLDLIMEDDGLVQLIAASRAEHALSAQLAETLRRWGVQDTPDIIDRARTLYQQHGAAIRAAAERNGNIEELRAQFPQFDPLDADYCIACEEDFCTICSYVRRHPADFAQLAAAAGQVNSPLPPVQPASLFPA
ncbi:MULTISPECIES: DUF4375 domain-containing protein [Eikenella]|uniref:DNA mimic protein DMP19 C-terminal domain-containing protein n=1 Tax=Eikenella longinqua TaxID=1795827 RepID=A0A1A9RXW3_9NEIS|nr:MULTISPECIES: DUF4375 domain-containing protein [Eikenella]OAM28355.1 hypothetical protein A7P95_05175 [Eikenella longinqua]